MDLVGRGSVFGFQTETTSEVAADALLALLYSKHAGARRGRAAQGAQKRSDCSQLFFWSFRALLVPFQELFDFFGDREREATVLPRAALPR